MSATSYTNIDDLISSILDSYKESGELAVIIDVHTVMPFLKNLMSRKVNNASFYIECSCNNSLLDDLAESDECGEPFMISIMKDGMIITERFHSEYEQNVYADIWYFIEERYIKRIGNLNPSYFSLFRIDFDPFEMY